MATLCTPFRIYNTSNGQPKKNRKAKLDAAVTRVNKENNRKHWRQHSREPVEIRSHNFAMMSSVDRGQNIRVRELEQKLEKYEKAGEKLKRLVGWNLRSTKSALKDIQDVLYTLEDLYGDEAFEEEPLDKVTKPEVIDLK